MSFKNSSLGKFLNDDNYDETDLIYLSCSRTETLSNFLDIPGSFNRQLWLFQTGQISEYSANYERIVPTINEKPNASNQVSEKNKSLNWEIHKESNSNPKNIKDFIEKIVSRGEFGKREHLTIFRLIDNKQYLYLRIQHDNCDHKSLKLGLYNSYEKWTKLIKDFKDGKPISELEKYCELNKEKNWETGHLPKDASYSAGVIADRSTEKIDEHLTKFMLRDNNIYLYVRSKSTSEGNSCYKSLKMGLFESKEKWTDLINDFKNGKSLNELEQYCEYE